MLADASTGEPYNASSGGGGGGGGSKTFVSNTLTITRPANTIAYQVGGLVATATTGLSVLQPISVTLSGGETVASKTVSINYVSVISSNGAAATKGQFSVYLFTQNNPTGAGFNDNALFSPTSTALGVSGNCLIGLLSASTLLPQSGTSSYAYSTTIDSRPATFNSSSQLFVALVLSNAYTPVSGEQFSISIAGTYS
jgi:hypothetical protein